MTSEMSYKNAAPIPDFSRRLAALTAEPSTDAARDAARLARVERSRTEMLAQGPAIAATLSGGQVDLRRIAHTLTHRRLEHVVIAGCGDSWFVGLAAKHVFESLLGLPCMTVQAFDYAAYDHVSAGPHTVVIGLSSGGNTPAVMAALRAAQARGAFTIGISNTAGSPIMTSFDASLRVYAERRGWPTQASTAAIALLCNLAVMLAEPSARREEVLGAFAALPLHAAHVTEAHDGGIRQIAGAITDASQLLFTGAGPYFATASFGAAKIRELSPVHAFAIPLEEMHHYRLPKKDDFLVIIAPDAASRERALDTVLVGEAIGATMLALLGVPDPDIMARTQHSIVVPEACGALGTILATIPLHLLGYHFAKQRAERAGS